MTRTRQFGATVVAPNRTLFRLWAPDCEAVSLEREGHSPEPMTPAGGGWFEIEAPCGAGTKYLFRVRPDLVVPDPAASAQDDDVHGLSVVVDHASYRWTNTAWTGRPWHEAVIYELHVGALGGFRGVTAQMPRLAALGITAIELMPVAEFPGAHNWGYDGVLPYAPETGYGTPDELRTLVDTAHGHGIMVLLDVVYNHFGPDGNYLSAYASPFYRHDKMTPWGDAIDFRQEPVRRFFIENAIFWLTEYRFDGLRFDAVHAIYGTDFLHEMARDIRAATTGRHIHLIVENEDNEAELLRVATDGSGYDAQWADDVHHCMHTMLTGEIEAYYEEFAPQAATLLARCLKDGFAFQEPRSPGGTRRGSQSSHLPPTSFVICLQNHDQIGNRAFGERLGKLAPKPALEAATALLLLTPQVPLLFMGQEWGSDTPFLYFASHTGELAEAVRQGRRKEFERFSAFNNPEFRENIPDPIDPDTFEASRPETGHAADDDEWSELHRTLLAIRAMEIVPRIPGTTSIDAQAIGDAAITANWRMGDGTVLSVALNLAEAPVACTKAAGRTLYETKARDDGRLLAGHAIEVTLQDAAS